MLCGQVNGDIIVSVCFSVVIVGLSGLGVVCVISVVAVVCVISVVVAVVVVYRIEDVNIWVWVCGFRVSGRQEWVGGVRAGCFCVIVGVNDDMFSSFRVRRRGGVEDAV